MLREYIYDIKFQIYIYEDYINIINYEEILSFSENKIIIKCNDKEFSINGSELVITKLLNDELLIKGVIKNIEFR